MKTITIDKLTTLNSINIDSVPSDEACAQINFTPNFLIQNKFECQAYADQIKRIINKDLDIRMLTNNHDFGKYYNLVIISDDEALLANIEDNLPMTWDEEALEQLKAYEYDIGYIVEPISISVNLSNH